MNILSPYALWGLVIVEVAGWLRCGGWLGVVWWLVGCGVVAGWVWCGDLLGVVWWLVGCGVMACWVWCGDLLSVVEWFLCMWWFDVVWCKSSS